MKSPKGTLTCPSCKAQHTLAIPKNVCMSFFQCSACKTMLKAKEGCCVFCDYGNTPCPAAPHDHP